jgi:hypothetical protein
MPQIDAFRVWLDALRVQPSRVCGLNGRPGKGDRATMPHRQAPSDFPEAYAGQRPTVNHFQIRDRSVSAWSGLISSDGVFGIKSDPRMQFSSRPGATSPTLTAFRLK